MPTIGRGAGVVQFRGLRDFQRDLKAAGANWPRELRKVNVLTGERAAEWARGQASSDGSVQRAAAYSIRGSGEQRHAKLTWGGAGYEFADGAYFGAVQYEQFPEWIGSSWAVAEPGQGPYSINEALAAHREDIEEFYLDAIEGLYGRAFPTLGARLRGALGSSGG